MFRSLNATRTIGEATHLVEEPAAAGITGAAVGDVGEPDGFFWSSSEDSKDVWPLCLRGKPNDSRLDVALLLREQNVKRHSTSDDLDAIYKR